MSHVPLTSGKTNPFTPDAIGTFVAGVDGAPPTTIPNPDIAFFIRSPTWEDRDMVSLRMFTLGVREVTADNIQNLMVSELFQFMPEEAADEAARFMEGYWQRQRQHSLEMQQWMEQEEIRRVDEMEAGRTFEATLPPPEVTTARERARINLLAAEVTDQSTRLRNKLADQQLYQKRFGMVIARLQIAGWKGLKTEAAFEPKPTMDAPVLTKDTIESLRSELMELDGTGAAWNELTAFCEAQFDLPRSAEKNLSSPVANSSLQAGLTMRSTESGTSDGASTSNEGTAPPSDSSSEPTPGDTSPTTPAP